MKTGDKDQKKDVMEYIEKLAVGGIKTLNKNEDDQQNSMSLNDIRKEENLAESPKLVI